MKETIRTDPVGRINSPSNVQLNYGAISTTSSSSEISVSWKRRIYQCIKSPWTVLLLWSLFILWIYGISPQFSLTPLQTDAQGEFRPFRTHFNGNTPGLSVTFKVHYNLNLLSDTPATGRLMVCLATKDMDEKEPRFYITDDSVSQQVFGVDVYNVQPLQKMVMNESNALGYPRLRLENIPTGEYWIQAVFRPYVLYNRTNNSRIWLPPFTTFEADHGVLDAEGTVYSKPILASISGPPYAKLQEIHLSIDSIVPERPPLVSRNKYLQHVKFRSPRLSEFWGLDVYLQAWILLPGGFYEHPDTKYPLFIYHSHYSREFEFDMIETTDELKLKMDEFNNSELSYGYYFYKNWTSNGSESTFSGKRGIIVQIQHANPYYDDSYAVNSENIGPYGDAISYEFLPYIEKKYRGIGKGWARTLYGGSTGGWESFAVQVLYPDEYNGCWSFCPDALDFHHVQLVNLYNDENAYYCDDMWTQKEKPAKRNNLGEIQQTMVEENHHELAQGSFGRSGGQWDAWQAVYSPRGKHGYPEMIWDKETGEIYPEVAKYWINHFDMKVYLEHNWKTIGFKLVNKLHIYVGIFDSFYLNDAVYLMDSFLQTTKPYYNGSIEYGSSSGKGFEHCWTGAYNQTLSLAWNTLNFRMIPKFVDHIVNSAPPDADLGFTKY